jgi:MFS superfamily sulfate permease-like transporter
VARFRGDGSITIAHDRASLDKKNLATGSFKLDGDQLTLQYTGGEMCGGGGGPGVYKVVMSKVGIHFTKGSFPHNIAEVVSGFGHLSSPTLVVGVATIGALIAVERFRPRWPAPLIAVAGAIAAAALLGLQDRGVELVGAVPSGFPRLSLPDLSLAAIRSLFASTLMLFALASIEVRRITTTLEKLTGRTEDRLDRDLVGQGLANLMVPFFGSIPVTMVNARSILNVKAGAATRRAAVIQSLVVVGLAFLLRKLLVNNGLNARPVETMLKKPIISPFEKMKKKKI